MQYLHFAIILRPRGLVRPRKSSCRLSALRLSGLATELVLLRLFKYPLFFFSTNPDPPVRARLLVSPRGTLLRHARLSLLLRGPTQLGNPTEQVPKGAGPSGRKQGQLKCYVHRLIIGSLSNDDGKKRFFLHFFQALTARLRRKTSSFHISWRTETHGNDFFYLFANLDTVL